MPRYSYDPDSRTLDMGHRQLALTQREGEALRYLMRQAPKVVSRAELETEVWGMRPGVRSQTVPVTIRRLRRKLGEDDLIETIWGVGWRMPGTEQVETAAPERFDTPFFDRPELDALPVLESSWLTVVGPGGVGKTRLVDQWVRQSAVQHVWIEVVEGDQVEDLWRRIAMLAGLQSADPETVVRSLGVGTPTIVVIDGADLAVASVGQLNGLHVVATSRAPIGSANEGLFDVRGLSGASGRDFLRGRLAAARWGASYTDAELDDVVRALDGLPLALELAAGQPERLESWVRRLVTGSPSGPEADRLTACVTRSLSRLDAEESAVLAALSLSASPISEASVADWLGPEAVPVARALGARSLVVWDGGWRVLRTVRHHLRPTATQRQCRDRWLVARVRAVDLDADPVAMTDEIAPIVEELLGLIDRVSAVEARRIVLVLCEFFATQGPSSGLQIAVREGVRCHPSDALLYALSSLDADRPSVERLSQAEASSDPEVRGWALWLHGTFDVRTLPLDAVLATIPHVERGLALRLERVRVRALVQRGESPSLEELWAFERMCRWAPRAHGRVVVELCWALDAAGQGRRALDLLELERPTGVISLDVQLEATAAFLTYVESPERGTDALHAVARLADRFGQRAWSADLRAYAAVFAWFGGEPVELEPHRQTLLGPLVDALLEGPGADLSRLKRSHQIASTSLWSGTLQPADAEELQRTRDGRILSTILNRS